MLHPPPYPLPLLSPMPSASALGPSCWVPLLRLPPPPDRCCTLLDFTPSNILVKVRGTVIDLSTSRIAWYGNRPHAMCMEGAGHGEPHTLHLVMEGAGHDEPHILHLVMRVQGMMSHTPCI